ncbi:hypothetical protein CR205_03975 [Alteribacter lacisalsi]|uniref:Uncharacterized protein n=1 Tax=Alteribacter lacisalsi TaxID=2045244 RepID=A0A2W0HCU3_9BACI|nr:hypothetical protein [Alteribacter lacisalsi]PYZ97760.1 hypothetical protein CR205_03975 [Alteribacter lacisalsi]
MKNKDSALEKENKHFSITVLAVWAFAGVYAVSYLFDQNWFPVTEGLRATYEPIYTWLFGS